ncbi:MAG: glycogen debranching protein GlgX [Planctomycetota bacterium]|nr:glycogen debranching protein GlgX [Planctomycetota bacterium]
MDIIGEAAGMEATSSGRRQKTPVGILTCRRGSALPLGATPTPAGVNFAVFSQHATSVSVVLFKGDGEKPFAEISLDPVLNRTGHVWHILVAGLPGDVSYNFRVDGPMSISDDIHRFNPHRLLLDPYARALTGCETWGTVGRGCPRESGGGSGRRSVRERDVWPERRCLIVPDFAYDWGDDASPRVPMHDMIVYELHVRGFTMHPSSGVKHPGTYRGLIEKIPYLKALGVNVVELMPVAEFNENENVRVNPRTGEVLKNFWGYSPVAFFSPKASYATDAKGGRHVDEFRDMVRAFHAAGIEVVLDVVFNHTAEGDERGPTISFRGLDNSVYYILGPKGEYLNFTGCGNTLNCNHPVLRKLIQDCLHYWVTEMRVDGFRFDLASVMGRSSTGEVLADPPVIRRMAEDPVLAHAKFIAEAWDAAGLYQVGYFPGHRRFSEWNGKFRDDVRRFMRGDEGLVRAFAARLCGSPDLYAEGGRRPHHSVNFVTSHDGFTLNDLVSYSRKHNEENGEDNRDGLDENFSCNWGVEGETDDPEILRLRRRMIRNFMAVLMLSQGVPMFVAGDEFGRTQRGNNNAYCQDNEISWVDWSLAEKNADLLRFTRNMIALRKRCAVLRYQRFHRDRNIPGVLDEIRWHGVRARQPDWSDHSHSIAFELPANPSNGPGFDIGLYAAINAYWEPLVFELPPPGDGRRWHLFADTFRDPPEDICEPGREKPLPDQTAIAVGPRSVAILLSR